MQNTVNSLTIGGLAKAAHVHVETIRYYQRRGLLRETTRPPGGIRRYDHTDLDRLRFVKTAQRLGFSLEEVAELLYLEDGQQCHEASALAEYKLSDIRVKIKNLQRMERVLAALIHDCNNRRGNIACPLIMSLHDGLDATLAKQDEDIH